MTLTELLAKLRALDAARTQGPMSVVERKDGTYALVQNGVEVAALRTFDPFSPVAKAHAEWLAACSAAVPGMMRILEVVVDAQCRYPNTSDPDCPCIYCYINRKVSALASEIEL